MIKRLFVILVSSLWLAIPLSAQSNKLIRELEGKRGALQKQIAETESILQNTKKEELNFRMRWVHFLDIR